MITREGLRKICDIFCFCIFGGNFRVPHEYSYYARTMACWIVHRLCHCRSPLSPFDHQRISIPHHNFLNGILRQFEHQCHTLSRCKVNTLFQDTVEVQSIKQSYVSGLENRIFALSRPRTKFELLASWIGSTKLIAGPESGRAVVTAGLRLSQ